MALLALEIGYWYLGMRAIGGIMLGAWNMRKEDTLTLKSSLKVLKPLAQGTFEFWLLQILAMIATT